MGLDIEIFEFLGLNIQLSLLVDINYYLSRLVPLLILSLLPFLLLP